MTGGGHVELVAVAFSALAQERELAWEPPMRQLMQKPENADFVWRRLQYVFSLDDPRDFPRLDLDWDAEGEEKLRRFVDQARRLAQASLLAAEDNVRISEEDFTGLEQVESNVSPPDVTIGFMTLLRQCYANDDEASFTRARNALNKHLSRARRVDLLRVVKRWQDAHADLLNKGLEERVQERLREDGVFGGPLEGTDSLIVRDQAPPHELLRTFWYGDQIHWGRGRTALAALQRDPILAALSDLQARAVALDFAHFYIGFAVLLEHALG